MGANAVSTTTSGIVHEDKVGSSSSVLGKQLKHIGAISLNRSVIPKLNQRANVSLDLTKGFKPPKARS
jgi:hypothetical protein